MLWKNMYTNGNSYRTLLANSALLQQADRLQREWNDLLGGTTARKATGFPPVNVWEAEEGFMLSTPLPGFAPEDIDISVVGKTLTIRSSQPESTLPDEARFYRRERQHSEFSRQLQLPFQIDSVNVQANFQNGILYITVPKAVEEQPKKISVVSG
jgi:HSP20 family protein